MGLERDRPHVSRRSLSAQFLLLLLLLGGSAFLFSSAPQPSNAQVVLPEGGDVTSPPPSFAPARLLPATRVSGGFSPPGTVARPRVLVLYAYTHNSPVSLANLKYFLRYGVETRATLFAGSAGRPTHVDDTFIVSRGPSDPALPAELTSAAAASSGDIQIVQRSSSSHAGDFCAYSLALNVTRVGGRRPAYTHFILLNSAVRGPFLPSYAGSWLSVFLSPLAGAAGALTPWGGPPPSTRLRMVGLTIACWHAEHAPSWGWSKLHVQSMLFALDAAGLRIAAAQFGCNAGAQHDVAVTQSLLNAGHAVRVLQGSWRGVDVVKEGLGSVDYTKRCGVTASGEGNGQTGDPWYPGMYDGGSLSAYETVFVLSMPNRGDFGLAHASRVARMGGRTGVGGAEG